MVKSKKPALGKGLSALLPDHPKFTDIAPGEIITMLKVAQIAADPHQPRRYFDEDKLAELAASIKSVGVMQPLLVASLGADKYRIIAGERRFRAAQMAGLKELPCIVRSYSEQELLEISLVENIQREDLTPLEEAAAFNRLIDSCGYTQEQLAKRLGKSRPHISNTLRLLQLKPQYQKLVQEGKLSAGHARAVLALTTPAGQTQLVDAILSRNLSVRQAEQLAKTLQEAKPAPKTPAKTIDTAQVRDLERHFTSELGLPVSLSGSLNAGKLVVNYHSADDLQNLIDKLLPDYAG